MMLSSGLSELRCLVVRIFIESSKCAVITDVLTENDADQCAPGRTATMAYHTLPEVKQFDSIIKSVHMDSQLTKAAGKFNNS